MEVMGVGTAASTRAPIFSERRVSIDRKSRKNSTTCSQLSTKKEQQQKNAESTVSRIVKRWQDVFAKPGNVALLSSLAAGLGKVDSVSALSYDEIVGGAKDVVESVSEPDFNLPSLPEVNLDVDTSGLTSFITENPLAVVGGLVVLALPIIAVNVFKNPQNYGTVSANDAFAKLGDADSVTQLIDIREADIIRATGTPDLRSYKKKVTQIPFATLDAESFVAKLKGKFKDADETTLYILDASDGSGPAAAKLLVENGFKAAYAVKGGADGPSGWLNSELPWLKPRKGFNFDLGSLKDVFDGDASSLVPTTLGVAAAAAVGVVVFSEAETALQLLGSAALVQIFVKKLLFAKDRKKTFEELQVFLDTKIAPKELVAELQGIGKVFLPEYKDVQAAAVNGAATVDKSVEAASPPPVEANPSTAVESNASAAVESPAVNVEEIAPPAAPESTDASLPIAAEIASEPQTEEKVEEKEPVTSAPSRSTDVPRTNRPLSPYIQFQDLKPPGPPKKP